MEKNTKLFIKHVSAGRINLEIEKTIKAYELSSTTNSFRVPKIVDYNLLEGWIGFEYFPQLSPLHTFFKNESQMADLIKRAGFCLGLIHNNLVLDEKDRVGLPGDALLGGLNNESAFLHGDFNLINVQYDSSVDQLVILDWSLSPYLEKDANWGPIYWDVGCMVRAILTMPLYYSNQGKMRSRMADIFLDSYIMHSNYKIKPKDFSRYCDQLFKLFSSKIMVNRNWYLYYNLLKSRQNFKAYLRKIAKGQYHITK